MSLASVSLNFVEAKCLNNLRLGLRTRRSSISGSHGIWFNYVLRPVYRLNSYMKYKLVPACNFKRITKQAYFLLMLLSRGFWCLVGCQLPIKLWPVKHRESSHVERNCSTLYASMTKVCRQAVPPPRNSDQSQQYQTIGTLSHLIHTSFILLCSMLNGFIFSCLIFVVPSTVTIEVTFSSWVYLSFVPGTL